MGIAYIMVLYFYFMASWWDSCEAFIDGGGKLLQAYRETLEHPGMV